VVGPEVLVILEVQGRKGWERKRAERRLFLLTAGSPRHRSCAQTHLFCAISSSNGVPHRGMRVRLLRNWPALPGPYQVLARVPTMTGSLP
jgi:hypothetical protein